MLNAISIDLEDWFCVNNLRHAIRPEDWELQERRVGSSTRKLLHLLAMHRTKATFFVLGWIADRMPELIQEIDREGHEIATHGYSHRLITEMTPEEFEADLQRALEVTRKLTRQEIVGFRAPSFTITQKTLWAADVLARHGIKYDSSVFPIGFHPDYGIPGASLSIFELREGLKEFPLSCAEVFGMRVPCSGGGYFRLLPYAVTRELLRRCNHQGRPAMFYLHPWEVDPLQPHVDLPLVKRFRHYVNLDRTFGRLDQLLRDFEFTTTRKVLGL
jgi:polysaccharide deacetylase family protein (PEP-CTERM system associated)